jgi:ACR3 family arsenite transporter
LARLEYGSVNFVVALLIGFMVYPMMIAVDFSCVKRAHQRPKGLVITLIVNWLIKPFTMAALGVLFFQSLFVDLIDPANTSQYIAGLISLGASRVTVVRVRVEVPVMLSRVGLAKRTRGWFGRGSDSPSP